MDKDNRIIFIIVIWAIVIILNLTTKNTILTRRLDKIENNQKEIIEILKKGDV
jgi:hypothetical protein